MHENKITVRDSGSPQLEKFYHGVAVIERLRTAALDFLIFFNIRDDRLSRINETIINKN